MGIIDADATRVDIGIIVRDMAAMAAFYTDVLGFRLLDDRSYASGTRMLVLQGGATRIKLNRPDPAPTTPSPGGAHRDAFGYRYLTVWIVDAQAAYDELAARGEDLAGPVRESPAGRLFFVRDPDGNHVELVEPVSRSGGDS